MKEKKADGIIENQEDKKITGKENIETARISSYFLEAVSMAAGISGVYFMGILLKLSMENQVRNVVMTALGIGLVGFIMRQESRGNRLDYNNQVHPARFWTSFLIAMLAAFSCAFLPPGGWPFTAVFITLSLFSSGLTGVMSGSVLLMMASFLSGADIGIFMLYFLSGIIGVAFFRQMDGHFQVWIPVTLSMMGLMVCETANIILFSNEHLNGEMFVIPIANVIVSSILLAGILKFFSSLVIYRYRIRYMELTDMEGELLAALKEEAKQEYFHSMHTAYFCDRIAKRLELDAEAVKTAGLYHKYGTILEQDKGFAPMEKLMEKNGFPPPAARILKEYGDKNSYVYCKETAILLFADAVTASVIYVFSKDKTAVPDYDRIIDMVFRKRLDSGVLNKCVITMRELMIMQKIFKEEKLYYDFLR